ncbi:serine/threonine protein kinase [Streptomyces sp. WAC 01529]|uniref:serine/threonine-protein kinase n=1 Tax=Streptomyces sp. WAC 01529 TaxID=2203205 RepID=UPI000F6D2B35|nr:serine/threonine-protein kinase [Streptomyces sp. WAC 01529]AZM54354.1 serine/threonine protein kinase [Streptomyces sp. WAC 01529]
MGEVFAGRYGLVDPIGHGGAGAVWRAWDHRRRRYVAAKVLQQSDAHALLRFVREQALRIDHPHVLAPASWAADDDKVLFTMDLVGGGSLAHVIGDYGPLPPRFVCTLLDQLLSGLAAVHAEGVVHRDIKPANILLEATGAGRPHLRLSDFGISMRKGEPRLTETDYVVGTPGYFAPEQMLGAEPDCAADLFAVGLVALYLLEGAKPDAKALIEHYAEHGTPGAPRGMPEPLWQVIATLLQPDPQARFRTATGARKALACAAEMLPEPGPDDELIEIFDQLPPLPPGFTPEGPLPSAPQSPLTASPKPTPEPPPTPTPQPSLTPAPHPGPALAPQPGPAPATQPDATPAPQPGPAPTPWSGPAPAPQPNPASARQPGPIPAPQNATPTPQQGLTSTPQPGPAPAPQPVPASAPQPSPAAAPHPAPTPTHIRHSPQPNHPRTPSAPAPPPTAPTPPPPGPPGPAPTPGPPGPSPAPPTSPASASASASASTSATNLPSATGSFHLPPPLRPPQAPSPEPTHVNSPYQPAPHDPAHAVTSAVHHPHAPAPPNSAHTTQVPPLNQAISTPCPPASHAPRRRPGPPAKVAVPMLLLALVCLTVGLWALTQL